MRETAWSWYGREMVEHAGTLPDAETSLDDSRAQFVASLGRRLEALRQALFALEQAPRSPALRDHLRRRIHAFGAAAGVLGFERVFEAFREAETVLATAGGAMALGQAELAMVARTVDLVPSLVLGAGGIGTRAGLGDRRLAAWPTQVLVFGSAAVAASLESAGAPGSPALECDHTEDPARAEEIVRVTSPDVAVVDVDRAGALELVETLAYDPLLDPVRVVAVGFFDRPEAAATLVALGVVRVLAKPVSPDSLKRTILEVAADRIAPSQRAEPIGEVTVEALGERLVHEIRRGLVEAVKASGRDATVSLGDGTDVLAAIWSSVARVRELVTLRSGGAVRFDATGPEGAVPLAPWMGDAGSPAGATGERLRSAGGGEARSAEGVSLAGRTIVVVDDDPSVVWFLSGLLRAAGAEVIECHDGAQALELSRACWPDLIVSDILMPGLDGFALCREVKRDIALSDVPVILLSWKEDLLQRVRELGADADGYLRKEATASTVVQRAREVLLPRARVEGRLATGSEVRGRLDGLTPRLVLELVCRIAKDAKVSVRDAAYLYEVEVRDGRVRAANRTSVDGAFDRGDRALSALLGVRAGRFAVRRDDSSCPSEWDSALPELVGRAIERARAAQQVLTDLRRVAHVEIDEPALEPYLVATPQSIASIVQRLVEGVPPADLLADGTSAPLLESVLVDLVLHGAIFRIGDVNGDDLLARGLATIRERQSLVALPAAKDFRTPAPPGVVSIDAAPPPARNLIDFLAAPATPAVFDRVSPSEPPPIQEPFSAESEARFPSRPPEGDGGFAALLADSIIPPAYQEERREPRPLQKGLAPPTSAPAEPSPLETALRSLPSPGARQKDEVPVIVGLPEAVPAASPVEAPSEPRPAEPALAEAAPAEPAPVSEPKATSAFEPEPSRAPSPPTPPGPPAIKQPFSEAPPDVVPQSRPEPPTRKEGHASDPAAAPVPTKPTPRGIEAYATKAVGPAAPTVATGSSPTASASASLPPVAAPKSSPSSPRVSPPPAEPDVDAESRPTPVGPPSRKPEASAASASTDARAEMGSPAERASATAPEPGTSKNNDDGAFELGDAVLSALEGADPAATPAQAPAAKAKSPATAKTEPPRTSRLGPHPGGSGRDRTAPARARPAKVAEKPAPAPAKKEPGSAGVAGIVTIVVISAASTFALMSALKGGTEHVPRVEAPAAVQVAPLGSDSVAPSGAPAPTAAPPVLPPLTPAPTLSSRELDLPPGLDVPADKGLLEFDVGGAHALYVDGVFVGVGPSREVPLRPGPHEVRVEANGNLVVELVQVKASRRTHLALTSGQ